MPTTQPQIPVLPEAVQEAVNLAHSKVQVLRDEELELGKKIKTDREAYAKMTMEKEAFEELTRQAKEEYQRATTELAARKEEVETAKREHETLVAENLTLKKESVDAKAATEVEINRRKEVMEDTEARKEKQATAELEHEQKVQAFEARKANVIELLKTI